MIYIYILLDIYLKFFYNIVNVVTFFFSLLTCSIPRHFGGAKADGSEKLDGNGLTNAPPPPLNVVDADVTAGCMG